MTSNSPRRALSALACSLFALAVVCATTNPTSAADDLDNIVFEGVIRDSAGAVVPAR